MADSIFPTEVNYYQFCVLKYVNKHFQDANYEFCAACSVFLIKYTKY